MKLLKLLAIILVVLSIGFISFKDKFTHEQKVTTAPEEHSQILYDRVNYLDYSGQNFASSKKFGRTLLFFAATTWCSNCKAIDEEIKNRNNELPKDLTILKIDYDRDNIMKAKHSVTMQTTLILLDKNGIEIKRWIGTDFDNLLSNLE